MHDWPDERLRALAEALGERLRARGETLAAAESCTGGWVAKAITDVAGSSAWFGFGAVTYANAAKRELLAVPAALLERQGAVSAAVVAAMASGVRARAGADHALAVSGIAGPDGGTADKPVGTVWFAWAQPGAADPVCERQVFAGDREAVRRAAVAYALQGLLERIDDRGDAEGANPGR